MLGDLLLFGPTRTTNCDHENSPRRWWRPLGYRRCGRDRCHARFHDCRLRLWGWYWWNWARGDRRRGIGDAGVSDGRGRREVNSRFRPQQFTEPPSCAPTWRARGDAHWLGHPLRCRGCECQWDMAWESGRGVGNDSRLGESRRSDVRGVRCAPRRRRGCGVCGIDGGIPSTSRSLPGSGCLLRRW